MLLIFVSFLFISLFLFMPKIFCLLYLIFRYTSSNNIDNKYYKYFDKVIFVYMTICLSFMIALRPYDVGSEIGFGEDMWHYYNAFSWVAESSWYNFFNDFSTITSLTGSGEPLFWVVIKIITLITDSNFIIHVILTFLGCLLVFLAGKLWINSGLLFVFLYTNTITFFAFQGSAIRSGLAFSFILLSLVLFLKNKNRYFIYLSPAIHFSMLPVPLIIYVSSLDFKKARDYYKLILTTIFFVILVLYFSMKTLDAGLGSKVTSKLSDNNKIDIMSTIQFFIENIVTFLLVFWGFKKIISKELKIGLIIFFFVCLSILIIFPSSFARFYRYEYIYFILIYSTIFMHSSKYIKFLILILSLVWFVFLGYDRFIGVFANNFFDYLGFNIFYRFN